MTWLVRMRVVAPVMGGVFFMASAATALIAAPPAAASRIEPGRLPLVHTIGERFMSFQVGFSHLTGGDTWKPYDDLPASTTRQSGFEAIREKRLPTDLANPRLRMLSRALAPLYVR